MMRLTRQFVRFASKEAKAEYPDDIPPVMVNKLIGPSLQHWVYNKMGFNKYGLYRDDILEETEVVEEAIKRLPEHVRDERVFRIVRAGFLTLRKEILPKEQWTKLEDDKLYLSPIVEQIEKERAEKAAWDKE